MTTSIVAIIAFLSALSGSPGRVELAQSGVVVRFFGPSHAWVKQMRAGRLIREFDSQQDVDKAKNEHVLADDSWVSSNADAYVYVHWQDGKETREPHDSDQEIPADSQRGSRPPEEAVQPRSGPKLHVSPPQAQKVAVQRRTTMTKKAAGTSFARSKMAAKKSSTAKKAGMKMTAVKKKGR